MKRNLNKYLGQCLAMCDECGIPYGEITNIVQDKADRRWGQCRKRYGKFEIGISYKLIDENWSKTDEGLINTILHEVLHNCEGCLNHGSQWKYYADKIRNKYGIDITRTSSAEKKQVDLEKQLSLYKYVLRCKKCNMEIRRMRMTDVISQYSHYRCGKCNGELERIK